MPLELHFEHKSQVFIIRHKHLQLHRFAQSFFNYVNSVSLWWWGLGVASETHLPLRQKQLSDDKIQWLLCIDNICKCQSKTNTQHKPQLPRDKGLLCVHTSTRLLLQPCQSQTLQVKRKLIQSERH